MADYKMPGEYFYDDMVLLPIFPIETLEKIKDFESNIEDICVATYPKSGTTWTQQILTKLYPEVCDPAVPLSVNVPFIEENLAAEGRVDPYGIGSSLDLIKSRQSPRLFKTHLGAKYFKKQVDRKQIKVIFVVRNIKDTLVSYYHHYKNFKEVNFTGDWNQFFEVFKAKRLDHGDFLVIVQSWLEVCDNDNVLLVRFEDMKEDLEGQMNRISSFCGRKWTPEEVRAMAQDCTFDSMKKNPKANYCLNQNIVRKGLVGEWEKYFTEEQSKFVDELVRQYPDYMKLYEY